MSCFYSRATLNKRWNTWEASREENLTMWDCPRFIIDWRQYLGVTEQIITENDSRLTFKLLGVLQNRNLHTWRSSHNRVVELRAVYTHVTHTHNPVCNLKHTHELHTSFRECCVTGQNKSRIQVHFFKNWKRRKHVRLIFVGGRGGKEELASFRPRRTRLSGEPRNSPLNLRNLRPTPVASPCGWDYRFLSHLSLVLFFFIISFFLFSTSFESWSITHSCESISHYFYTTFVNDIRKCVWMNDAMSGRRRDS